ncbi:MAG: TRAP transporter TatT component family protein [Acidobacteriota bacterium]|jgi:tetratricopeptide (TPR) repeat protein
MKKIGALFILIQSIVYSASFFQTPFVNGMKQADALYQEYRMTGKQQSLRDAVRALEKLKEDFPNDYSVLWKYSRACFDLGDDSKQKNEKLAYFVKAIESARKAAGIYQNGVEGHYWLGVTNAAYGEAKGGYKALSLVDHIRKELEAVIKIDSTYDNGGAYMVLGRLDYELPWAFGGNNKRAILRYEEGLKIAPDNLLMKAYLAESLIYEGHKDEARKLLNSILAVKPGPNHDVDYWYAQNEARKLIQKHFK